MVAISIFITRVTLRKARYTQGDNDVVCYTLYSHCCRRHVVSQPVVITATLA